MEATWGWYWAVDVLADPALAQYTTWDQLAARLVDARAGALADGRARWRARGLRAPRLDPVRSAGRGRPDKRLEAEAVNAHHLVPVNQAVQHERLHARMRRELLASDARLERMLAFSGRGE